MVTTTFSPNNLSLYIHLPFCRKKCPYCSFYVIPYKEEVANQYIQTLKAEWSLYASQFKGCHLVSLYFGGGTPSLHPQGISELITFFKGYFDLSQTEITVEVNPEDGNKALFTLLKQSGVNRLSLGAQTLSNPLLHQIGRAHSTQTTESSIKQAQDLGLTNISIDLMTEIPDQTLSDVANTLDKIEALNVTHLSLYNLQIEKGTSFYKHKKAILAKTVDSSVGAQMLQTCVEKLTQIGFNRYEISAFCKPGFTSKHNVGYWIGRDFLGLGASSFSYLKGRRFQNVANINKYEKQVLAGIKPISFDEQLSQKGSLLELLALHLRLTEGFCLNAFEQQHGQLPSSTYRELERLVAEGLVNKQDSSFALSSKGTLFFDDVAPRVIA
tara:strand:- start:6039 stop:7187 length:1149 start_codon:yes stop_codon:yes gene_type:complete